MGVAVPAVLHVVQWRSFDRTEKRIQEDLKARVATAEGKFGERVEEAEKAVEGVGKKAREELEDTTRMMGGEIMGWLSASMEEIGKPDVAFLCAVRAMAWDALRGEKGVEEVKRSLREAKRLWEKVEPGDRPIVGPVEGAVMEVGEIALKRGGVLSEVSEEWAALKAAVEEPDEPDTGS